MMREFEINVQRLAGAELDASAGVVIGSGETVFTRLLRQGANTVEDRLEAPPGQLAFWLVDNWWRLRWECVPPSGPTPDWRLAHDLAGIGGYAWPRLAIWGEGDRIGLSSRSDPAGVVGPVRYLTDALIYVSAAAFEDEADKLFDSVSSEQAGLISDRAALRTQMKALSEERADPEVCAWRRLEAQLGFDVDEAPEALMESLSVFQREYGAAAVAEAAMATQGAEAAAVLEAEIGAANDHHWQCDLRRTAALVGKVGGEPGDPPWRLGEIAAAAVLKAGGQKEGPLSNSTLAEILNVRPRAFYSVPSVSPRELAYGLRLNTGRRRGEIVALISRWSADRRFEFSRALGDAIWSEAERLGPLTRAKSERQKFQRAFAQSLLCPYGALAAYIGDDVSDGAIAAAARYFLVSERLIRSVLVNKRVLERQRLLELPPLRTIQGFEGSAVAFDEVVEAA
jgi:hypothetical protein